MQNYSEVMSVLNLILILSVVLVIIIAVIVRIQMNEKIQPRQGYILIPCVSGMTDLERIVKSYYWEEFFQPEHYGRDIILVQLDKSEINFTAKRLEQDYSIVHSVDITELADFIKRREIKCYGK